jgi:putative phosphoribosyl transferase
MKLTYKIKLKNFVVEGDLTVPLQAKALVFFVHGCGSRRYCPENIFISHFLNQHQVATFLFDFSSVFDQKTEEFDLKILSETLVQITAGVLSESVLKTAPIFYYGSSLGTSVPLVSAEKLKEYQISGIISRAERLDFLQEHLHMESCPLLLIVGSKDQEVLQIANRYMESQKNSNFLKVIYGAGHLFAEPGMLEQVGQKSLEWINQILEKELQNNGEI